jgi:tetratricopeptide (TPR) repeat protein
MKKNPFPFLGLLLLGLCMSVGISAQRFGKVDNLFEYVLKGQTEKFDKVRLGMKPKEVETFPREVAYADNLRKAVYDPSEDCYEAYFKAYVDAMDPAVKSNIALICTGMKIGEDSLKRLADNQIMRRLEVSKNVQEQGRCVLAALDRTGYPVTDKYRKTLVDMIFNAQYSDLLTAPSLDKYRAFIKDWPSSDKLPSVKQNYDDALFAESERAKDHDLYLMDVALPNDTKKHLVPDDWSLYGDKYAAKGEYTQATSMYGKAIQLGSREGLFKLTVLKYEGKIKSEEDELITFQKLAAAGDARAKDYVTTIQNKQFTLAVEGSLASLLNAKDRARVVQLTLAGPVNDDDLRVLREMATNGKLTTLNLAATTLTKLPDRAFQGGAVLTALKLPESLREIGSEALEGCAGLTELVLPDTLTQLVGNAFDRCTSLTALTLPASLIRGIGFTTFCAGCKKLSQFMVKEGNASYSSLDGVLYNKEKTILLRYPCGKEAPLFSFPNTIAEVGIGAFEGSTYLSSITLPESLKTIRNAAFMGCTSLSGLVIPAAVAEIGANAFESCSRLSTINLPVFVTDINYCTFKNCSALTQVTLPETVREIRSEAFLGCSSLATITLNSAVKGLGDNCFSGCLNLKDVYTNQTNPLNVPASVFTGVNRSLCTLHVPVGTKTIYQQYPVWKDFVNIVEPQ